MVGRLYSQFKAISSHKLFWLCVGLLLIIRVLLFIFLAENDFAFVAGDSFDYLATAHNVIEGKGFVSNEFNPSNRRAYLGENYFYAGEPGYPLFIAIFLLIGLKNILIVFISNFILYLIIIWVTWKFLILLKTDKVILVLVFVLLIMNPHLEFYSLLMLATLLRVTLLLAFFYCITYFTIHGHFNNISSIVLLGILGGILILTRISFLFIPLLIIPVIVAKCKNRLLSFVYVFSIGIVLLPWFYRNYQDFGRFTLDVRVHHKIFQGSILDVPEGIDPLKEELASIWRITDNEKFWRYADEKDPVARAKMLEEIENTPYQWIKLYSLRLWEIFKPFPTGGDYDKLILQIYSLILYLPWLAGLLLFLSGSIKRFKPLWLWFSLGILSFVGIHVLQNSPHGRYMLPLVPLGYICFFTYIQEKWHVKERLNEV